MFYLPSSEWLTMLFLKQSAESSKLCERYRMGTKGHCYLSESQGTEWTQRAIAVVVRVKVQNGHKGPLLS